MTPRDYSGVYLGLTTHAKFWAVLEAIQQYIDNGNDAIYDLEPERRDEFNARLAAAEELRDKLEDVLASLGDKA
jgi:hypothetical protein